MSISDIVSYDNFAVDIILPLGIGISIELDSGLSIDLTGFADNTIVAAESSGRDRTVNSQYLSASFREVGGFEFSTLGDRKFAIVLPVDTAGIDRAGNGGFRISNSYPLAIDQTITGIHLSGVSTAIKVSVNGAGFLTGYGNIAQNGIFGTDISSFASTGDLNIFKRAVGNIDDTLVDQRAVTEVKRTAVGNVDGSSVVDGFCIQNCTVFKGS